MNQPLKRLRRWYRKEAFAHSVRRSDDITGGRSLLVLADCYGRLANRLTVLAHALAYAEDSDAAVADVTLSHLVKQPLLKPDFQCGSGLWFDSTSADTGNRVSWHLGRLARFQPVFRDSCSRDMLSRFRGIPVIAGSSSRRFDLGSLRQQFPKESAFLLAGIFIESFGLRETTIDSVRENLAFREPLSKQVSEVIGLRRSGKPIVGVHVRHGDYRFWEKGRHYYALKEYAEVMHRIERTLGRSAEFLVVSDEPQDVSEISSELDVRFIRMSEVEDLCLLSQCDYLLATHSSYANWASFIGRVPLIQMASALSNPVMFESSWKHVRFPYLQADYLRGSQLAA